MVGQGAQVCQRHLGLGVAVGHEVGGVDAEPVAGQLDDRDDGRRLGDLDVRGTGVVGATTSVLTFPESVTNFSLRPTLACLPCPQAIQAAGRAGDPAAYSALVPSLDDLLTAAVAGVGVDS